MTPWPTGVPKPDAVRTYEEVRAKMFGAPEIVWIKVFDAALTECAEVIERLANQLDAVFHEFTNDMEEDAWEATLEWLRRDYPDLARRYAEQKGDK